MLVPVGVCLNEKQPQEQKIENSAQNFNLLGPKTYPIWGCRSTCVYHDYSGSRACQPYKTQAKPENLINCAFSIRKPMELVG